MKDIPAAKTGVMLPDNAVYLGIDRWMVFRFSDGKEPALPVWDDVELVRVLKEIISANPNRPAVLVISGDVPFLVVDDLIRRLKEAGIERCYLATGAEL